MPDGDDYSRLEAVIHDHTANSPERDRSTEAPEHDQSAQSPQVRVILFTGFKLLLKAYLVANHRFRSTFLMIPNFQTRIILLM